MEILAKADERALLWLNGWAGRWPWLDALAQTVASDYLVPVAMGLMLLALWFTGGTPWDRERRQRSVFTALAGLTMASWVVLELNKVLFRPRPFQTLDLTLLFYRPVDSSFPANPAAVVFAIAAGVWLKDRRSGTALAAVGALYSLSRVYVGVFYPSDVLGGAAIGVATALLSALVLRWLEPLPRLLLRVARAIFLA
ncbi:MAG: phosphatase PAP2 family protein [Chloroflexi bacterium]|nr:phosphatase PAP2 family protein [Chloroflexota bacterium]